MVSGLDTFTLANCTDSSSNPAWGIELPSIQGLPQIEHRHPSLVVSLAAIPVGQLVIIRVGNRPGPVVQRGRATGRSRLDAVRRPVKALRLLRFRLRKNSCPEYQSGLIFNWSMVQAHHGLTPKPPKYCLRLRHRCRPKATVRRSLLVLLLPLVAETKRPTRFVRRLGPSA